jgi:hypothetical protein
VVPLLGPRVREVQEHFVEARGRQPLLEHIDGVLADYAQVPDREFFATQHQVTDPGAMHLDSEEVLRGLCRCQCDQCLAISEADLDRAACAAPEDSVEVEHRARRVETEPWPQVLPGAMLCPGHPPGAGYEADARCVAAAARFPSRRAVVSLAARA